MARLTLIMCVGLAGCAGSIEAPVSRIDASSAASFERSIVLLQNSLPARRREQLEVALGVLWLRNTPLTEHDIDSDGVITRFEAQAQTQALNVDADELLTEIRRGDLLSAIEKRETADSAYTATDYRRELDGLTDVEVIDLANLSGAAFEARRQANAQKFRSIHCWHQDRPDRSKSRITLRRCS